MSDLEIYMAAPEDPSPEELAAYIEKKCGGDSELQARVEALFGAASRGTAPKKKRSPRPTNRLYQEISASLPKSTFGPSAIKIRT